VPDPSCKWSERASIVDLVQFTSNGKVFISASVKDMISWKLPTTELETLDKHNNILFYV
jgi:hypothetical protein